MYFDWRNVGYKELKRRLGLAFISLLVLLCILVVIAICALIYAIIHPNDQLLNIATQGFSQGIKELALIFIGALIAVLTSALLTFFTMDLTISKTREDTIIGLYYELKALQQKIEPIPLGNHIVCLSYIVQHKIHLYTSEGLYFVLKKELFSLDTPILEKVLDLYPEILLIDEISDINPPTQHGSPELLKIHEHMQDIKTKMHDLIIISAEEKKKIG